MNRLCCGVLFAAITLVLAACGGGSAINPPPPAGNFSNASLHGQYAFSMSGVNSSGAYIARVGSFVADGNGAITSAIEDVVVGNAGGSEVTFTGGTYTIQANGRGLLVLNGGNGSGLQLNLSMVSSSQGILVQTDLVSVSNGGFSLQTPAAFSSNSLNGNFVLDFSGISISGANATPLSIIGTVTLDGNGSVTSGTLDENDSTLSSAIAAQAGTYQLDATGNGTTFGRGTMTFDGRSFAFYIVDQTRIKVLEEDFLAATQGDAMLQSGVIPTQNSGFIGSFVYLVGGASLVGNQGALARVARFTADGNGGIATISYDENNDGAATHVSQGSNISNAAYAIDTTHTGSGRGTFTFTDSHLHTLSYVFYLFSPTQAVIQDVTSGVVADGPMQAQSGGPFTNASVAGNYAFNWSGINIGQQNFVPLNENFVGQYMLSSAATTNLTGIMDYTEAGTTGSTLYSSIGLAGTLTINTDGSANNTLQVASGSPSSTTFNFAAYVVDPSTTYVLCTDSTRVTAGITTQQTH